MSKSSIQIVQLSCLKDNYCALIHDPESGCTVVVDTPDGDAISRELKARQWQLSHILTTHHHWDHIDGHQQLKAEYGATVAGPAANAEQIPALDIALHDGDVLEAGTIRLEAIATPGHTLGHMCYYSAQARAAFVGDTLFSMGCGRLFEGTPAQMWQSMLRLRQLPADTALYCGHEYTLSNAKFALALDPGNQALQQRAAEVSALREQGLPTLPTSIAQELQTNPFMRADALHDALGMSSASDAEVFAEIRARKDNS
ncbi:MAG: hydroxyacylglutathione hydrolase [Pseudomonadales bacterium]